MSRKLIIFILAVVLCLSAFLLVSCGGEETPGTEAQPSESTGSQTEPPASETSEASETSVPTESETAHVHDFTSVTVTKEPTCTEEGERVLKCACGETVTEKIEALGHNVGEPVVTLSKQPTCTEPGYNETEVRCNRCGEVLSRLTADIPALGHNYENGVCTRCGEKDPSAARSIKLLAIGNSFSSDAIAYGTSGENRNYLVKLLQNLGYTDITIGSLEIGSCSLKMHYDSATLDNAYPNATDGYRHFYMYKDGAWKEISSSPTIKMAVTADEWDFVTIQEVSGSSGKQQGLTDYLPTLIKFVRDNCKNENVKIGWHSTWAYMVGSPNLSSYGNSQAVMYGSIIDVLKYAETFDGIDFIIPSGTAVQNIRTSYVGETVNRDGSTHMSNGIGRYTASMVWASVLSGQDASTFAKLDGFSDYEHAVVTEAVSNAVRSPYNYTKSSYPYSESELKYIEQGYVLFDWHPTDEYYLNGSKLPTEKTSSERNIASSVAFTKADIPVGSIIVCNDKFSYTIELWPDGNTAGKRVTQKQNTTVTVDDAMWNGYSLIAFTVKSTVAGGPKLAGMADVAAHNLRIWVKK